MPVHAVRSLYAVARKAISPRVARSALKVALVVGTLLNLINQGEHLLLGESIRWGQLLANYLVPFCVSSYSAARSELERGTE